MSAPPPLEVDVRPLLARGEEPRGAIMRAITALAPGQGLRLLVPFRPLPLIALLGERGFTHTIVDIGAGDWEVVFFPPAAPVASGQRRT